MMYKTISFSTPTQKQFSKNKCYCQAILLFYLCSPSGNVLLLLFFNETYRGDIG